MSPVTCSTNYKTYETVLRYQIIILLQQWARAGRMICMQDARVFVRTLQIQLVSCSTCISELIEISIILEQPGSQGHLMLVLVTFGCGVVLKKLRLVI